MRRELASYFATPLAYVFILIFLVLANAFTFYLGGFYERGQADLDPFFTFHPWLYLFLIPAISMKLWAEERKSGSIELLMTQPVELWRSEEHTSELQSQSNLVCRLLLEKKKKHTHPTPCTITRTT